MSSLNRLSATSVTRKLAAREITAEALLADCLARIAEREREVHAWTFVDTGAALRRARALDAQGGSGLLHGLPIAVKDLFDTVDMPSSYGSPIYGGHRPAWDAACVAMARAAGGIVVGKTVTTEFATFHPGPTCNPRNLKHTPGGSSSGSAAAVADWMVPLAFGTQTAGSIVRPAAFCGTVGYKPTFGTVSRVGVKMISDSLDTIGALARSVPDAALFVAALADRRDLLIDEPADEVPRIGLCRTHEWNRAHPETVAVFEDAGKRLRAAGASVRDVTLPPPFTGLVEAQLAIMQFEVAKSLTYENLAHRTMLSEDMTKMIDAGLAVSPERYDAARSLTRICRAMLSEVFREVDVLLAPSAPGEAPVGIAATGDPLFNRIWTLLHVPVVHLPVGHGPNGLPVGITVVGSVGADRATLRAADWMHARLGGSEATTGGKE
ncbi:MAG TPA: amidase [Casimicrobiaceae bacterium]|jgi:Asp-tRNA(Asn)/Glu-tRNA(Gln) amidotransferase A subunit family amidase